MSCKAPGMAVAFESGEMSERKIADDIGSRLHETPQTNWTVLSESVAPLREIWRGTPANPNIQENEMDWICIAPTVPAFAPHLRLPIRRFGMRNHIMNARAVQTIVARFSMESVATRQMRLYATLMHTGTQIAR